MIVRTVIADIFGWDKGIDSYAKGQHKHQQIPQERGTSQPCSVSYSLKSFSHVKFIFLKEICAIRHLKYVNIKIISANLLYFSI